MRVKRYDKLVRDRIPEIIANSGAKSICETLGDEEYGKRLNEKLIEEAREYAESGEIDELADICEVFGAILRFRGISLETVERVRAEKRERNGGFEKRLLLKEVRETDAAT